MRDTECWRSKKEKENADFAGQVRLPGENHKSRA